MELLGKNSAIPYLSWFCIAIILIIAPGDAGAAVDALAIIPNSHFELYGVRLS